MSAFALKLIACITMLIDHIGLVFKDDLAVIDPNLPNICRLIGRIAFPLFAFGIAEGAAHTSSPKKYLRRMFLFALIAQLPFMLMVGTHNHSFSIPSSFIGSEIWLYRGGSVMVTLFLALCICLAIENNKRAGAAFALGAAYLFDYFIGMDYGLLGVLFVVALYLARENRWLRSLVLILFAVCFYVSTVSSFAQQLFSGVRPLTGSVKTGMLRCAAMCIPAVLLLLYNGKRGPKTKLFLYVFYPAHMLILWIVWAAMHLFV